MPPDTDPPTSRRPDLNDRDSSNQWLATVLLFAVGFFYFISGTGLLLGAVNVSQMWSLLLAFFVAGFIYFSSGIETIESAIAMLHSAIFGLLAFSIFVVAETSFFPPVPFPIRTRLLLALFGFLTVGILLWILFGAIHGPGFPNAAVRIFDRARNVALAAYSKLTRN